MDVLEFKKYKMKRRMEKEREKIRSISQEYNVPYWKAALYFYNSKATKDFLCRTHMSFGWSELYDIIGHSNGIRLIDMLDILEEIMTKLKEGDFSIEQEFEYEGNANIKAIEKSCEKCIKTECPNIRINVDVSIKNVRIEGEMEYIGGGCTHQYAPKIEEKQKLHIKVDKL